MEPVNYVELAKQLSPWVAALAALLGVFVAGALNLATQLIVGWRTRCVESNTLRLALVAEINGMVTVITGRRYLEGLDAAPDKMMSQGVDTWPFGVKIADNYCPVYQANAVNIGLLKPAEAAFIVGFHQIIQSVIQDVTPGGVLYEGGTAAQYGETYAMLKHAIDMDAALSKKVKIPKSLNS